VPRGVDGDVLVRGPMVAKGYLDPVATQHAFREDGYFRTGDRGHLREDGQMVLTGRSKDMIIRKGENIGPGEIEELLMTHPKVAAVAVIGLPDAKRGERVCAVVETPTSSTTSKSSGGSRFRRWLTQPWTGDVSLRRGTQCCAGWSLKCFSATSTVALDASGAGAESSPPQPSGAAKPERASSRGALARGVACVVAQSWTVPAKSVYTVAEQSVHAAYGSFRSAAIARTRK